MNVVIDTSVVIAVIANEPHKARLVDATRGATLIAPASLPAEIGNAFSAMLKQKRIRLDQALAAMHAFHLIAIRLSEINLEAALQLAGRLGIYAYDAYMINCAIEQHCPIVSLDGGLIDAAKRANVQVIGVDS